MKTSTRQKTSLGMVVPAQAHVIRHGKTSFEMRCTECGVHLNHCSENNALNDARRHNAMHATGDAS